MIKLEIKGLDKTVANLAGMSKQLRYATAVALTKTARAVANEMPAVLDKYLDKPTPFTKRGLFVTAANKQNLTAVVGFRDRQASYLKWQIEGGSRPPARKALKLPSAIRLDQYGNIPKGVIAQLVAVARKEGQLKKRASRRIAVSNKLDLFYGDPKDVGGHKFPPGIYKIVKQGVREQLVPLVVFPQRSARYKPRLPFRREAERVVEREWRRQFDAAFAEAVRTAR